MLLKRLGFTFITICTIWAFCEGFLGLLYRLKWGQFYTPKTLFERHFPQLVTEFHEKNNCTFFDTQAPHPYLAYINNLDPKCGNTHVNSVGFTGNEHPLLRPKEDFVVLLTGGSVANQLLREHRGQMLQNYLNTNYIPPKGKKRFYVIGMTGGDYRQPQQAIALLLRHHIIDAFMTLDGYNEAHQFAFFNIPETPSDLYLKFFEHRYRPDFSQFFVSWLIKGLYYSPFKYSYNAYLLSATTYTFITNNQLKQRELIFKETFDKIFNYPQGLSAEVRQKVSLTRYQNYYKMMHAMCQSHDIMSAFFIQPFSLIGKELTELEKLSIHRVMPREEDKQDYINRYKLLSNNLLQLSPKVPIVSLLDIFQQHKTTIYSDEVHISYRSPSTPTNHPAYGHLVLMENMVKHLEHLWGLKRKNKDR